MSGNNISLNESRKNFKLIGAMDKGSLRFVRRPLKDERIGLDNWVTFG